MEDISTMLGEFTWNFGKEFYIQAENKKNYIWKSPMYGGDNTLAETTLAYDTWIGEGNVGRSKGTHIIGEYTNRTHVDRDDPSDDDDTMYCFRCGRPDFEHTKDNTSLCEWV